MAFRKGLALLQEAVGGGELRNLVSHHSPGIRFQGSTHLTEPVTQNSLRAFARAYDVQPSVGLRGVLSPSFSYQGSQGSQLLHRVGFPRPDSDVGPIVKAILGAGSRGYRVARWTGKQEVEGIGIALLKTQGSGIGASTGRRRYNLSSLTDRWKTATGKIKESVLPKGKAAGSASNLKAGVSDVRSKELVSGILKPVNSVKQTVIGYREALGLQVEAFWKRNYLVVVGAVGVGVCLLLWRVMFGIASTFVSLSEGMAKFGFLALAAAMVTLGGIVLRAKLTINPDAVYRIAMRRLNTSAEVLEVMGAPLTGTDVRAYVMSGGGLRIKNFRPRLTSKRCFIIFPITGSERKGLVSIEVKKKRGQYDFKLLAVDIPTAGADHRVYLAGDEAEYRVGGGLISVLRDPIVKAMSAQKEFEERDEKEEEDDLQREWELEQAQARERSEKLEQEAAAEAERAEVEEAEKERIRTQTPDHEREPLKA